MFSLDAELLEALSQTSQRPLFQGILRGVERETLRVSPDGLLSKTPHPQRLGSALTHPQITTDFSEALLEFITPPTHQVDDLLLHLDAIHRFAVSALDNELLWAASMPCALGAEHDIPVARYGGANIAQMKTIYRLGLGERYGRAMQTVAGVHYNFSLPSAFWAYLHQRENSIEDLRDFIDRRYFGLIRNYRRHFWLLIYLFGASPALCRSFVGQREHSLETLGDGKTLYLPYATSLRMGDLGYQSRVQEQLYVCYNDKSSYIRSLCQAITRPHPDYARIGVRNDNGAYKQLNASALQIENEFYSAIRPKRTARTGETALSALGQRGVEYIEVRSLDINPFTPLGIDAEQIRFIDTFLVFCALLDSPNMAQSESNEALTNQKRVVHRGRDPDLQLNCGEHGQLGLRDWGLALTEAMKPVAELLDHAIDSDLHARSLALQTHKLLEPSATPSAQLLNAMTDGTPYGKLGLALSQRHTASLKQKPLSPEVVERMEAMAEESLMEQRELEAADTMNFDDYLAAYYAQYQCCG